MICGIYLRLGTSAVMCLVFFLFCLISVLYFVKTEKNRNYFLLLLFLLLGFFLAGMEEMGEPPLYGKVSGSGLVRETGETSGGNQSLTIIGEMEDELGQCLTEQKIYALWTGEERFSVGDCIGFSGEIAPFYEAAFPGAYDEREYLQTRGFDCKVYPDEVWKTGVDTSLSILLAKGRYALQDTLDRILPAEESGVMKAMLTGEKDDIPQDTYELYRKAGTVHVLCISGLHMSILALYIAFFLEKILKRSRRVSALLTMAAGVLYLAFIGFTPSAARAVIMISVVMLGRVLFRLSDRLNNIAIAAFLILCLGPGYLFHAGFQLSFITVIGICLGVERLEKRKKKERTLLHWFKESLLVSLYASLFSFPVVAYHFYAVSLVGILANLVILPLSGLLLGFGILAAFLGIIWLPAGVFAAGSVYVILQLFQGVCEALLGLPFACILTGRPSLLVMALYYLLLFFLLRNSERKGSWRVTLALCGALWCGVFENQLFRKENTVAFLSVGQGDAAVISTYDGKAYLVDGGGVYGKKIGENVGMTVVLPYLESLGIREIEAAFLSHPDTDHMTGLLEIMAKMPVKGIYLSDYPFAETEELLRLKETVEKNDVPLYTVRKGDISADGQWECLYPLEGVAFGEDDNHGSMALRYRYGGRSVLFTGDMAELDEMLLLAEETDLKADILKVAHHGSAYSSSAKFLEAVSPEAAVISCGLGNIYGHPHEQTMERLQAVSSEIYRTDQDSSIFVTLSPDGEFTIETMTERKPFYERIKETMEE